MSKKKLATEGNGFKIIPENLLKEGYRSKCHVEGWNKGCVFIHEKTINGVHHLRTPKTGKLYMTTNRLMYTRMNTTNEKREHI